MSHSRKTDSFKAKDLAGVEYTINVFTEYATTTTLDGPRSEMETGYKTLKTTNGQNVNSLGGNNFQILAGTKEIEVATFDPRYIGGVK